MGPRRPENGPAQDSTGVCTGTQPLCRPQPLDPEPSPTICLPQGPNTKCEAPGPGGGPGSGPGTARPEPTTPWSVRAPPCPRQRRARQPPCFLQRWARLPQVTRSKQPSQRSRQRSTRPRPITERGKEEIPGQAARTVEPQAAAITALVNETRPITGRGGESFQPRRRGRSGRGGHGRGWSVQADHGRGRGGPGRSLP